MTYWLIDEDLTTAKLRSLHRRHQHRHKSHESSNLDLDLFRADPNWASRRGSSRRSGSRLTVHLEESPISRRRQLTNDETKMMDVSSPMSMNAPYALAAAINGQLTSASKPMELCVPTSGHPGHGHSDVYLSIPNSSNNNNNHMCPSMVVSPCSSVHSRLSAPIMEEGYERKKHFEFDRRNSGYDSVSLLNHARQMVDEQKKHEWKCSMKNKSSLANRRRNLHFALPPPQRPKQQQQIVAAEKSPLIFSPKNNNSDSSCV